MKVTEDFADIEKISYNYLTTRHKPEMEVADKQVHSHASFSFGGNKGSTNCYSKACHNYLRYMTNQTEWLVNYYVKNSREEAESFLSYLTTGPYKNATEDAVFYKEDGVTKYIAWDNLAKRDIKLLSNFLIATRLISEFNAGRFWRYLLDSGFCEDTAFILMNCCNYNMETGNISSYLGCSGDLPLSPQIKMGKYSKYLDPIRLYERTPLPGISLKNGGNSYLCNYIWGGRDKPLIVLKKEFRYGNSDESGNEGLAYSDTLKKIDSFFKNKEKVPKDYIEEIEETLKNGGQLA